LSGKKGIKMAKKISDVSPVISYKGYAIQQVAPNKWVSTIKVTHENPECAMKLIDAFIDRFSKTNRK
jgi:hypothetical protein